MQEPGSTTGTEPGDWLRALEIRAGTRWITWIGATALVVAAALFVKLAIDEGWLGPVARLALGSTAGIALVLGGLRAHRAEMRPLAHGLFGAGLGVLYVTTYVAFASHGIIPRDVAFGAMVAVTVVGCALAVRHDAQPVAVLALIGGLVTPVAVSTGDGSRDALFLYLAVLDLGVVAIALLRRWRVLEAIAFGGTWFLFAAWVDRYHDAATWHYELAWLGLFHVVLLVLPFAFHLRRRIALDQGRFWMAILGAAVVLALAIEIVDWRRDVLGLVSLAMAATYHAIGAVARRRLAGDGRAHFGFVTLAVVLATLSIPLLLRDHGITLAWSLEAPVLLALGFHYRYFPIRLAGLGVLGLAAGHLAVAHWPRHDAPFTVFFNLDFASAMMVPAAAALYAIVHRAMRSRGDARDRWLGGAAAFGGAALALIATHVEIATWFGVEDRAADGRAVVPLVWAAGAMIGVSTRQLAVAFSAGVVATGLVMFAYVMPVDAGAMLAINPRFAAALATALAVALAARLDHAEFPERRQLLWAAAVVGLGAVIGAEAFQHHDVRAVGQTGDRAHTALSIAWSGYAAILLTAGFARANRLLRLGGLALFGTVAGKLVLVDLAGAAPLHRVVSFVVLGALLIGASYAYHRFERSRAS